MRYLPHTQTEIDNMLKVIGVKSLDDLFTDIPESYRLKGPLKLEPTLDEVTLQTRISELAERNQAAGMLSFLGAGMYAHHIPPAVDQLLLRSEFYTAYTPYQAELSQGTLQAMFEFQTIVSELLGLDVANASMYDAASAVAEAALMARRVTGKDVIAVSAALHPEYIETLRTYLRESDGRDAHVQLLHLDPRGQTDTNAKLDQNLAAIIIGYPNFLGCVEDLNAWRKIADGAQCLLVSATQEAYALSCLKSPGSLGVDIAVGEGQSLAVPPQFGGPGVGLFACKQNFIQKMPGRLIGKTVDQDGKTGYVLTLSTREQHIRRERATSNICTNHGLIALSMTIRCAMLGKTGFVQAGKLCLSKSEYLKQAIGKLSGYEIPYATPTFNEFVVRSKTKPAAELLKALEAKGILGGVPLSRFDAKNTHDFLVAVTERHTRAHLDQLVSAL